MFSTLRNFLVFFLTLMQFIAPLEHAHAGEHGLKQGLDVPGFEYYGTEQNTLIAQMKTSQYNLSVDGMIVGVDLGLNQNQTKPPSDGDNNDYLHQQTVALDAPVSQFAIYVSPQPQQFDYPAFIPAHSPRAPPAR